MEAGSKNIEYSKPLVCLLDVASDVNNELSKLDINCTSARLGSEIVFNLYEIDGHVGYWNIDHSIPDNLHEFDIAVMDLTKTPSRDYVKSRHAANLKSANETMAFVTTSPENIFDSRPLSLLKMDEHFNLLITKPTVFIAFCGREYIHEYRKTTLKRGLEIGDRENWKLSNLRFYNQFPKTNYRSGKKIYVSNDAPLELTRILNKYIYNSQYGTVFEHPIDLIQKDEKVEKVKSKYFTPLLYNELNEVVGCIHVVGRSTIYLLPDIESKSEFITDIFKNHLPNQHQELFPNHGAFKWLELDRYAPRGHHQLVKERANIENKFASDIKENERRIHDLYAEYKPLSSLLTETGEPLVRAVAQYLIWLGFASVKSMDEHSEDILEEDIQVDDKNGLLVIEVKGIGGTSTDAKCSQISKIIRRRTTELKRFDVFGLYIVNHQRYLEPELRSNPPFTDPQIDDAKLDRRGLITTYELFKAHHLVGRGIMSKTEICSQLYGFGCINLAPENLIEIGIAYEFLTKLCVAILNLNGVEIKVGDELIAEHSGEFDKVKVLSIKLDDSSCESAREGEVGIRLDKAVKKKSKLFKRIESEGKNDA